MSTVSCQVVAALFILFNIFFLSFYLSRFSFYIVKEKEDFVTLEGHESNNKIHIKDMLILTNFFQKSFK